MQSAGTDSQDANLQIIDGADREAKQNELFYVGTTSKAGLMFEHFRFTSERLQLKAQTFTMLTKLREVNRKL